MQLATRASELRLELTEASYQYFVLDRPTLSDREYDLRFRELQDIERAHPELQAKDSPTRRVGLEAQSALPKHVHLVPMLSLDNAFDEAELLAWDERLRRLAGDVVDRLGYCCELKIDGAAVSLT